MIHDEPYLPGHPDLLALEVGGGLDARVGLGHDDRRELAVDRRDVDDRDPLADGRDDRGAVAVADVDGALAEERDEVGVDLVLEVTVSPASRVVPRLVGEVELRELDARDVARGRRSAGRRGGRGDAEGPDDATRPATAADADGVDAPVRRCRRRRGARQTRRRRGRGRRGVTGARAVGPPGLVTGGASPVADQAALDEDHDEIQGDPDQGEGREGGEHERDVEQAAAGDVDQDAEAATRRPPTRRRSRRSRRAWRRPACRRGSTAARPGSRRGSRSGGSVARKLRAISSRPGSTVRIPTIVAMATGKNTISVVITSLLSRPVPNHRTSSGASARIGVDWAATR